MIDITQQKATSAAVDDEPEVTVYADGPEIGVLDSTESMEPHSRVGRVELQVKCLCLYRPLLCAPKFGETVNESVGNAEIHGGPDSRACEIKFLFVPGAPASIGSLDIPIGLHRVRVQEPRDYPLAVSGNRG